MHGGVNYHWDNDRDLILILRAVRFGYLLSTLLFSKFVYNCYKLDLTIYNLEAIGFEETLWAAIGILVLSRLTVTFMSVQIAFCRNLPTFFPLTYSTKILGMEAIKIGVGVSVSLVALSGMPFIAPNGISNGINRFVPGFRGYGFDNMADQTESLLLEGIPSYRPNNPILEIRPGVCVCVCLRKNHTHTHTHKSISINMVRV